MRDEDKPKEQLIIELNQARRDITQFKEREVVLNQTINNLLERNELYQLQAGKAPPVYQSLASEGSVLEVSKTWLDLQYHVHVEELIQDQINEFRLLNEQLMENIIKSKQTEEFLLRQHERLQEQLSFSSALNLMAEAIISNVDTSNILQTMAEIIGSTLSLDRSFIYEVNYAKHQAIGQSAWSNPTTPNIRATKNIFSLDLFADGFTYMKNHHQWLESHIDDYGPCFTRDGSGDLVHKTMGIKSGFCFPFSFSEQGYYCLTFAQIGYRRIWRKEEIEFLASVANLVGIAIQKINFLTEQKQQEETLRLSEESFHKIFHYSSVSLTIFSLDSGEFIDANESCLKMHGYTRDEFIGRTPKDLNLWVETDDRAKFYKDLQEKGFTYNNEIRSYRKSGEIFENLFSGIMIDLNGKKCILGTHTDITELRQCQRQITRLDSLNLIGEMAAGIAHEIRNPMTTVKGFLQLLSEKKEYDRHKRIFTLMVSELDRANSIITEFLSLVKNKPLDLKMQDLNSIIENLFPLIQADALVADKYVSLELNRIDNLLADGKELRQLILNLVRNGFEAMSPGGKLTIKTCMSNNTVVLVVQDQGKGIDSNAIDKIGTPFFTTKDNGTGLGLATCYNIAARHNATINFDTSQSGTNFYVSFKAPAMDGLVSL